MNRLLTIFSACIIATVGMAQNIVVKYNETSNNDYGAAITSKMTLIASPEKSLYYNVMSQYVDSCRSTPEGAARLKEIQMKAWRVVQPDGSVTYDGRKLGLAPDKQIYSYVEKDADTEKLTVYDFKSDELCYYDEPIVELQWETISDSTKNILGFECVMASTDYHGRKWKVWFTPELPVQDGPWKLHGLPGLILEADGGDGIHIEATEVGSTSSDVPYVYSKNNYEKKDRKQILADHEHYINNFEAIINAQGIKLNADGSPSDLPAFNRQLSAWETDYK